MIYILIAFLIPLYAPAAILVLQELIYYRQSIKQEVRRIGWFKTLFTDTGRFIMSPYTIMKEILR